MNPRILGASTPEERLAAAVMRALRHLRKLYGSQNVMDHVDHADFVTDLRPFLHRELLLAKDAGLRVPPGERERERVAIAVELAKVVTA